MVRNTKAKFKAMANRVCEVPWIQWVPKDLRKKIGMPMKLFCDNKTAISIAQKPTHYDRTKHIEVNCHFIQKMETSYL